MSNETKFTSGPWSADSPYSTMFMVVDSQQQTIAEVQCGTDEYGDYLANEKEQANAHLIAAAPEMYDVIIAMLEQFDAEETCHNEYDYIVIREAKKVLAKARGES